MTTEEAKKRIKELVALINYHNNLYYNKDTIQISDSQYDALFKELTSLEKKYPSLKDADTPTLRIGGVAKSGFKSFVHPYKMLGLSNVTNFDELLKFDQKVRKELGDIAFNYSVEYKMDGLAVELYILKAVSLALAPQGETAR